MDVSVKRKKYLIIIIVIAAFAALAAAYVLIVNAVVKGRGNAKIIDAGDAAGFEADCILVLGAGLRADGSPSDMLADRLKVGVQLYVDGASPYLLMSGDHSRKDYDEVSAMADYAMNAGVPEDAIAKDFAGFSTYESLYRAKELFGVERVIIVTQKYHLYRAIYIAESLGLEVRGVPADLHTYRGQTYRDLREILARNKDFIYAIFKPEPTYLGDKIPLGTVSGDT